MISAHQLAEIALLLRAAARTEILPRFGRLSASDVSVKSGPLDLVTVADVAAERMITSGLRHLFPGCVVVGEEATASDPGLLGAIADAPLCFVVDPIDGTANYAAGLPLFGCMAAAIERGRIVASIILDPMRDDVALALDGGGAWTEAAGRAPIPLRVAAAVPVSAMSGGASWRYLEPGLPDVARANLSRVASSFDLRCAAHQYRMLAAGHCHYMMFGRMMPWDHAPGWLLHREAGGYSARLDGTPYDPAETTGGLLCAPDPAAWTALRAALLDA